MKHTFVPLFEAQFQTNIRCTHFLNLASEYLFVDGQVVFRIPFVKHDEVARSEIGQEILPIFRHGGFQSDNRSVFIFDRSQFQVGQDVAVALFGPGIGIPGFGKSMSGIRIVISRFRKKLFPLEESHKGIEIGFLRIFHLMECVDDLHQVLAQILLVECTAQRHRIDQLLFGEHFPYFPPMSLS